MKIVAGEGKKKSEILGGPAEGGPAEVSRGGGPAEGESGGAPKSWTHPRKILNTQQQRHTTQRVVPRKEVHGPKNKRHEILPKSRSFPKVWAQNGLIKKRGPRDGLCQNWSETLKNMAKIKKILSPSPKTKNEMNKTKNRRKNPQNQKNGEKTNLSPPTPLPDQKKTKNQKKSTTKSKNGKIAS